MTRSHSTAALATKHGKEAIFAPLLAPLDIDVVVSDLDTDMFGTFAGEIERTGTPHDVVVAKARAAASASHTRFGLSSEGSFGPHASVPFVMVDRELVAWIDTEHDHVIVEHATALSNVPPATTLRAIEEADALAIQKRFPDQAAIVIHLGEQRTVVAKAITNTSMLREAVTQAFALGEGSIVVEPDLRAHLCPDRREVIATAVQRLAERLATACPDCTAPGYGSLRTEPGLLCGLCGLPTTQAGADVFGCTRCQNEQRVERNGTADPTYCDRCNP